MNKRILCFVLAIVLVFGGGFHTLAASVGEVKQKQNETQSKLNEINKSITAIESKKKQISSELSHLNEDLVETMLGLELLEADLEAKQLEIDEAQAEYDRLKLLEEQQYEAMKLRIQYMYEKDTMDYIAMIFEAKSLSDLVNRTDFAKEVSDYDNAKRTEYQETKNQVEETKNKLEEEQELLLEMQHDQMVYKESLDKQIKSAKSKVANFESELSKAQAKAKEYQNTIKQQSALITQLEEEARRAAEQQEENSESAESSGGTSAEGSSNNGSSGKSESPGASSGGGTTGDAIARYALQFVGNPYVAGGTSLTNGADCSGFTWAVHKHFGITIPRVSRDQAKGGKSVSLGALQPGDIIYYVNHVAIYIGNGRVVHASTEKTGIKTDGYNYRTPSCARRYW